MTIGPNDRILGSCLVQCFTHETDVFWQLGQLANDHYELIIFELIKH